MAAIAIAAVSMRDGLHSQSMASVLVGQQSWILMLELKADSNAEMQ